MKKYIEGLLVGMSFGAVTEFLQASEMPISENLLHYAVFPLLIAVVKLALEPAEKSKNKRVVFNPLKINL